MGMPRNVVVIAGPTGSGETTITKAIIGRFPDRVCRLITATTRAPREDEHGGVDYYFFSKEDFLREKEAGRILEYTYIENRDTYYGSYGPDLQKKIAEGRVVIVNPDIVGTTYYKEHFNATTIFIAPESVDVLMRRIRARSPEMSEEEIAHRRENAEREMSEEQSLYDYVVVNVDGKLDEAVDAIVEILNKEGYTLT